MKVIKNVDVLEDGKFPHKRDGKPQNVMPVTMFLCLDSRKEDCPYFVSVSVETRFLAFQQGFCGYSNRKYYISEED